MSDAPYRATSINERAMEWQDPLWAAIHSYCASSLSDKELAVVATHEAVEIAMRVAIEESVTSVAGCGICGGKMCAIRGKHPRDPERVVCPTCLADRFDMIREFVDRDYGRAFMAAAAPKGIEP